MGADPADTAGARAEQRWRLALEAVGDGVWDWNAATGSYYSPQWKAMLGYDDAEFANTHEEWEKRIHPDDLGRVNEALQPLLEASEAPYRCEYRLRCKDGSYRWVLGRGRVIERVNGKAIRILGTHNDITRYKEHEAEVERLNRLYAGLSHVNQAIVRSQTPESLLDAATGALVAFAGFNMAWVGRHDPATRDIVVVARNGYNRDYADQLHLTSDEAGSGSGPAGTAIRLGVTRVCNDFLNDPVMRPWRGMGLTAGWRSLAAFPIRAGDAVWGVLVVYSVELGFFGNREVDLLEEVAIDVSFGLDHLRKEVLRREAEESLQRSEQRLRMALDAAALSIWERDIETNRIAVDDRFEEVMGLQRAGFDGTFGNFLSHIHPADVEGLKESVAAAERDGTAYRHEYRSFGADGQVRWLVARGNYVRDGAGGRKRILGVVMDVTERKRAEEALARSEARYRRIVDTATEGIWLLDENLRTTFANRAMRAAVGTESDIEGKPVDDFLFPDDIAPCRERFTALQRDGRAEWDQRYRHASGREVETLTSASAIVDDAGQRLGYLAMLTDVTERRRAERERLRLTHQVQQAQKLESVGRLAGGVAHDFNNLLTVINGYAGLVLKKMHHADPLRGSIEEIRNAGERATGLVRQLLAFSRKQVLRREPIDLNRIVGDMEKMLPRLLGEDVEITVDPAPSELVTMADPHQMEQVLLNLTVNSRDAMPHGGVLTIRTGRSAFAGECPLCSAPMPPGEYVRLTVQDTGTGIEAHIREHLFEPFFTTKPVGKGTGLGLATVYGIVMESDGHIDVESEPGAGTAFHVWLPAAAQRAALTETALRRDARGGSETILVVEDQAEVRRFVAEALRQYGYNVLAVSDGESALAECSTVNVDLLLTDVVMPRMSGPELARRATALRPGLRVLLTSGYAESAHMPQSELAAAAFLQKPYSPQILAAKVREVLGRPRGARILVVDDEESIRRLLRTLLEGAGHTVVEAADLEGMLRWMETSAQNLVIADFNPRRPGADESLAELKRRWPSVALAVFAEGLAAAGRHVDLRLNKPIDPASLLEAVDRLLASGRVKSGAVSA